MKTWGERMASDRRRLGVNALPTTVSAQSASCRTRGCWCCLPGTPPPAAAVYPATGNWRPCRTPHLRQSNRRGDTAEKPDRQTPSPGVFSALSVFSTSRHGKQESGEVPGYWKLASLPASFALKQSERGDCRKIRPGA